LAVGYRQILVEGAKEDKTGWSVFLGLLKERGLHSVELIVSDSCMGLVESAAEFFPDACRYQLGCPGVLVVEAAEEGDCGDRAGPLDRAADRGIFRKSEVDTGGVVVVGVGPEDLAKMGFAEDQDMVQAFSSDRADEPFGVTDLPRRLGCGPSIPNPHRSKTSAYDMAIGGISVSSRQLTRLQGL
jgi:hypothetical protein